jgi:hypothetical protein
LARRVKRVYVTPAQAGVQFKQALDTGVRRCDE